MKFLFLTDTHAATKGPASRTDSYVMAVKEKLQEAADRAKAAQVEAVIHGGDLFDRPVVSETLKGEIARIIRSSGVPWYVVPGNHDLFGYNIDSLPQTSLGLLASAGVIQILDRRAGELLFLNKYGETVTFEGQEYYKDIDKQDPGRDYFVTSQADYRILVPHSMLLSSTYFPEVPHTVLSDLVDKTGANLILSTHYHDGYPDQTIIHGNQFETQVIAIGSTIRDEASKGNLIRVPQYMILDLRHTDKPKFTTYPYQCAAEGVDIFDRTHIDDKQRKEYYLDSFEKKLTDANLSAIDVRTVLDQTIAQSQDIDLEIEQHANVFLDEAEKEMTDVGQKMTGYVEKPNHIWIESIHIKGYQSHHDTKIDFSKGLNVIVGPSDSGKSSVIRALRFVLYNQPRGTEFIRQASKSVSVEVVFSDGAKLMRKRTRASAGEYLLVDHQGLVQDLKGFSNQLPVDVANIHQMPYVQLTKDLETSLNIGQQLEAPFLIGESPGARAAVIGQLTGVTLVDNALKDLNKQTLGFTRDMKIKEDQFKTLEERIHEFNDLPDLKQKIDWLRTGLKKIQKYETELEALKKWGHDWQAIKQGEGILKQSLKALKPHLSQEKALQAIIQDVQIKDDHERLLQSYKSSVDVIQTTVEAVDQVKKDAAQNIPLYEVKALVDQRHAYLYIQETLDTEEIYIQETTEILKTLPETDTQEVKRLTALVIDQQELSSIQQALTKIDDDIIRLKSGIRQATKQEKEDKDAYQALLEEWGYCPTCSQPIPKGGYIHA